MSEPPPYQPAGGAKSAAHSQDYAPYPKLDPNEVAPSETWTSVSIAVEPPPTSEPPPAASPVANPAVNPQTCAPPVAADAAATTMPMESNPYVSNLAPPPASSVKSTVDSVKDVLGKWGKKAVETTKKGQDLAGNMWQHCKHSIPQSIRT